MSVPNIAESSSSESPQLCRQFTFSEIQLATQNLDESLVIGHGGFGKVYKGTIANGSNPLIVAIKRLDSTSDQGASEFWAEVNMLSNLRHCHLVSLIGYCNDGQEMIIVYEYMSHGTLEYRLHKCQIPLSWMLVVDRSIDEEQWALAIWAQDSIKKGRLKQIVDTNIRGSVSPKCLKLLAQLAKGCLHKHLKQRPTTAEVVVCLESILALQEKANNKSHLTNMQNIARFAPAVISPSNVENSGGSSVYSLESYFNTIGGENKTLRRFDLDTLVVATENFSEANKISPHTCEPLYKGKLQNGLSIAVAPTSSDTQREKEYMNGASILVKVEHENVAKLLGYCIKGESRFLVYELALLESLDRLMFDPTCTLLNWDTRYKIVLGVAKALLYLHKDAPVQVIHCDVQSGSILLDESLNAKLSCFWNARCLAINKTVCRSFKACKNFGYIAPEYVICGKFSTKTDVYSFGVMVLEIITGRRMMMAVGISYDYPLNQVQRNWFKGTLSNIIDPRIDVDSSSMTSLVEIGLLCVQKDAADRPTMEEVVSMLLDRSSLALPVEKMREKIITAREFLYGTGSPVDDDNDSLDSYYTSGADEDDFLSELVPDGR
ncbi:hypothetical protein E3N88_40959 [Mikania micrantha]|uniref:Protein kinase domain-containing protein n=1 Tax=Mikania micrantha TaxID=192012 RepID=A0A5N6LP26_9ASTR|nr:hypothetical protein E3N88_40959 [Mikania micrantha]